MVLSQLRAQRLCFSLCLQQRRSVSLYLQRGALLPCARVQPDGGRGERCAANAAYTGLLLERVDVRFPDQEVHVPELVKLATHFLLFAFTLLLVILVHLF